MSGRRTYSTPHPSARGGWIVVAEDEATLRRVRGDPDVRVVALLPATWQAAENALGRALTADERQRIGNILTLYGPLIHDAERERVSREDRIATLRGFATGADARAFDDCDDGTRALLTTALLELGIRNVARLAAPSRDDVARAAKHLLDALEGATGALAEYVHASLPSAAGRPHSALGGLLRALMQAWHDLGGRDTSYATKQSATTGQRHAPGNVRFVAAFLAAIGQTKSLRQVGALLTAHVPRQGR